MVRTRALLVSIENYQNPVHNLPGLSRDVAAFAEVLGRFGIYEVQSLQDRNATQQGIMNGLNKLVAGSGPGDVLVFYYTGHGVAIPATNQPNKTWEGFVPWEGDTSKLVPDFWIKSFLRERLHPGASFYGFYDSCHSGQMFKLFTGFGVPELDEKWRVTKALFLTDLDDTGPTPLASIGDLAKKFDVENELPNSVHFGAAEPDNTALVRLIQGEKRSCFTWGLEKHCRTGRDLISAGKAVIEETIDVSRGHHKPVLATAALNLNTELFHPLPGASH